MSACTERTLALVPDARLRPLLHRIYPLKNTKIEIVLKV